MLALLDGDIIAYRCAASVKEDDPPEVAILRTTDLVKQLLHDTGCSHYEIYLTGKNNFRKAVYPEYKANRKDQVPPRDLDLCKDYLQKEWQAQTVARLEADDLLGINQTEGSVICTIDKDLLMIPGQHYSWQISGPNWIREAQWTTTKQQDCYRYFYKQMLIGDKGDNIIGVHGIGPKKAEKLIEYLNTEQEMFEVVSELYDDPKRFVMNAQCLWIMQNKGETWAHRQNLNLTKQYKQEVDMMLDFMTSLNLDT